MSFRHFKANKYVISTKPPRPKAAAAHGEIYSAIQAPLCKGKLSHVALAECD